MRDLTLAPLTADRRPIQVDTRRATVRWKSGRRRSRRAGFCPGGLETRLRPLHQSFRVNDGAGVLTLANFAARIEGFDLELVEFAFHAEERGSGGNPGVVGRGCQMLDVDRYSHRKLARLEQRLQGARASRLHQGDHARGGKNLRENILL